ncbi:hypothetical protein H7X68_03775 [Candidatus Saccharibacteria bacterium]|nr:hypothetical protein [Candidatus Saccharibacteria bacterium]
MKIMKQLCLATLAAVCLATGLIAVAEADPGGRTWGHGYFTNAGPQSGGFGRVLSNGITATTSKSSFINEIKAHHNAGGRDGTGASFIIQTMRGNPSFDHARPSAADIADWEDRINDPSVTITLGNFSYAWNSGFMKGVANDDAFYPEPGSRYSLIFRVNGVISYVLKQDCANPLGALLGLPKPSNKWTLSATSTADRTTAKPGQTITWTHRVRNNGPDPTTQSVRYGYKNSGDLGTGSTMPYTLPSGFSSGSTRSFTSTRVVSSGDVGKTFCRSTIADTRAWNNSGQLESIRDCVAIPLPVWTISPTSTANRTTARPGDLITWTHRIINNGPDPTNRSVRYHYQNRDGLGNGFGVDASPALPSGSTAGRTRQFTSTYRVTQNDVNRNLCRATSAQPRAWNNNGWIESATDCVFIPYNYNLNPNVNVSPNDVIEPGSVVGVTPSVGNTGPTKSQNTQWQLTQIIVRPNGTVPTGGNSPSNRPPCGLYFRAPPDVVCSTLKTGATVFDETGARLSGDVLTTESITAGDLPVGTRLCFAFSVQPRASSSTEWRHSLPICVVAGKKPKAQVYGGDLSVGKAFSGTSGALPAATVNTSTSVKDISGVKRTFGSWVEYGIFATGVINGTGSGSAYVGPGMDNTPLWPICLASKLSFTNAGSSTCGPSAIIGRYATTRSIPDVAASFRVTASTPSFGNNASINLDVSKPQGLYTATGNVSISGGGAGRTIAKGQWLVLNAPTSTVTITDNINYTTDTLQSITDIPQLVIIANKIIINDNVANVDAWLIANGTSGVIETCNTGSPTYALSGNQRLTSDKCNVLLTVNGPVMAKQLWLRRTAGSGVGGASGDPAEIFNLRPDAYLWAQARAASNGRIQTVYTTELPPRL